MQSANDSVKHFTMAGYSGTPLPQKLGIKPGTIVVLIDPPDHYRKLLGQVPSGVNFATRPTGNTKFVHLFVRERGALAKHLQSLRGKIAEDAAIWVSWPKKSSSVATNVTEDVIRAVALPLGFVDIKVCAVDETWSGLKLMIRRENRKKVRFVLVGDDNETTGILPIVNDDGVGTVSSGAHLLDCGA